MWEIAVVMIFIGLAGIFSSLAIKLDDEHSPLKLLFLIFVFFILIGGVYVTMQMTKINYPMIYKTLSYIYKPLIFITIFVVFYFVIYFVYKSVKFTSHLKWQRFGGS